MFLSESIKGLKGADPIKWTPDLSQAFAGAKAVLQDPKSLTLPCPSDKLSISVDASPLNRGLGATMFVIRGGEQKVAEFFSFKLKDHHCKWLPCELEALAISTAASHFAPYISESRFPTQILTDSKPCVQAWNKLQRGEFSASARVSTFLSVLASLNITLCHIKGTDNVISDHSSRNPLVCNDSCCQVCRFVNETVNSVVGSVSISDVLEGKLRMPFLCPSSWRSAQQSNEVCRSAFNHLQNGTRPTKKTTKISREIKTILNIASINRSKTLLVVRKQDPYVGTRELIYCPKEISSGLIVALHLMFHHASKSQLRKLFDRHFYSVGSSSTISDVVNDCSTCNSLKKLPKEMFEQSSTITLSPGKCFSADVMRRAGQKVLVVRDMLTSFTSAAFTKDETAPELRNALIITCLPLQFQSSVIRVDCAPALRTLCSDSSLLALGIEVNLGDEKNPNKNPVADKAIEELELELLKLTKSSSPVSAACLTQAVCNLNGRIRHNNLSAKEMFFGRDQMDGSRLNFSDEVLSSQQHAHRMSNHLPSARCKARGGPPAKVNGLSLGSLVFIKHEGNKFNPRQSYVIVALKQDSAVLQKMSDGKFSSRQYTVPIARLFPCVIQQTEETKKEATRPTLSSSDDDDFVYFRSDPTAVALNSSPSADPESSQESESPNSDYDDAQTAPIPRGSSRTRRLPDRYGDPLPYDTANDLPGESNLTQPWWPGYPRGTVSTDPTND